jgi:hypothetical protein
MATKRIGVIGCQKAIVEKIDKAGGSDGIAVKAINRSCMTLCVDIEGSNRCIGAWM